MDAVTLLYRTKAARKADWKRKAMALRTALTIVGDIDPAVTEHEFLHRSASVIDTVFGGGGYDSYITTALAALSWFEPDLDVQLAALLNAAALQMNFQTRTFLDGAQAVVYYGDERYFPIAMLHGNTTLGLYVGETQKETVLPAWANKSPTLELNPGQLHYVTPELVPIYQNANGGSHTSAVMIVHPKGSEGGFSVPAKFEYIAETVGVATVYCIAGSAEMIAAAAVQLEARYPHLRIDLKLYALREQRGLEYRAILMFAGLPALPEIVLEPGISKSLTFGTELLELPGELESLSYGENSIAGVRNVRGVGPDANLGNGIWERTSVKSPFYLASSAPLPLEARERLSDEFDIFHSVLAVREGMLIPSQDPSHATFLAARANGEIIKGYGSDAGATPFPAAATADDAGVLRYQLRRPHLRRVRGSAMPLMFTPMLHKWHSHFMIQCLPRVRIARDLGEDMAILIPHDLRRKQVEMLHLLGIDESRLVRMKPNEVVQADRLYVPLPWRLGFTPYNTAVYDEIAGQVETALISTPKRILISRESRKTWRNLINYDTIRQMLVQEFGFEEISPEKLTLAEEVAVYANADIVVGAEGAGMYGAVFSGKKTKYITICDEDYVMPMLSNIAVVRGFDVGYVFGESMRADGDVERRLPYGHADFVVDGDLLRRAIEFAIA